MMEGGLNVAKQQQDSIKRRIFLGFETLLTQIPFSKITVQMIADQAHIHRNTVYLHFTDKHDLLAQFLDHQLRTYQLNASELQRHPFQTIAQSYAATMAQKFIKQVSDTEFIQGSTDAFCRAIIRTNDGVTAYQILGKISAVQIWAKYNQQPFDVFRDYQKFDHMINGGQFPKT